MELKLNRTKIDTTYTIGKLYINESYFCDTLQSGTTEETITGGTYPVIFTFYWSLKKEFPVLMNVPEFGVAAINYGGNHFLSGNIIVGKNSSGTLINCEETWNSLVSVLKGAADATEDITILIT